SLVPTAKCGLSKVGACQNNVLSAPPPPDLVGLYSADVAACATPAWAKSWAANGAVRPRPIIWRTKARRDIRRTFTAATSCRISRSSIEISLAGPADYATNYSTLSFARAEAACGGWSQYSTEGK